MAADKKFTLADVQETSNPNKPLLVIDNVVYDVTTFMNEVRVKINYFKILY